MSPSSGTKKKKRKTRGTSAIPNPRPVKLNNIKIHEALCDNDVTF